ncbi:MAG TPA: hypothetical protein VMT19_07215 [Thermoanaerobaculaceae bacterium]|nr:hypothetical protein [Thermoanaerobaculaceae bacterium]
MKAIPGHEREAMDHVLIAHGYSPEDFEATVEESAPGEAGSIDAWATRTVTVRRKGGGHRRRYRDLPGTAWIIDGLQLDLVAGLFGRP